MGIYPNELPPIMCAICGKEIGFVDQAVAIVDKNKKHIHWQCWLEANKPPQKD